jgi:hypothetical protein
MSYFSHCPRKSGKTTKNLRIAGLRAEIWALDLPNTKQECQPLDHDVWCFVVKTERHEWWQSRFRRVLSVLSLLVLLPKIQLTIPIISMGEDDSLLDIAPCSLVDRHFRHAHCLYHQALWNVVLPQGVYTAQCPRRMIGLGVVNWIRLAQDRDRWRAVECGDEPSGSCAAESVGLIGRQAVITNTGISNG